LFRRPHPFGGINQHGWCGGLTRYVMSYIISIKNKLYYSILS